MIGCREEDGLEREKELEVGRIGDIVEMVRF